MDIFRLLDPLQDGRLDEAAEELGKPDPIEEGDLRLHVGRCARRWKFSYIQAKETKRAVDQLRLLVIVVVLLTVLTARPEIAKAIAALFGTI